MNRPTVNHTRSTRGGESRPLRLQRIRRPAGKKEELPVTMGNKNGRGKNLVSTRSMLFHQNGGDTDDMSDYDFSVAPCPMNDKDSTTGSTLSTATSNGGSTSVTYGNVVMDMDCDTVGDESLYTTANTAKQQEAAQENNNWEDQAHQAMDKRKNKMALAGMENSIPTCIFGGGNNISSYGVSKLDMGYGLSGRSIGSLMSVGEDTNYYGEENDPTEEETDSHHQQDFPPQKDTIDNTSIDREQLQVNVNPIQEEVSDSDLQDTNHTTNNTHEQGILVPKKKKKPFFRKLWNRFFTTKTTVVSNGSKPKNHKMRQSVPMQRSPTELWNSTPAQPKIQNTSVPTNTSVNPNTRRARTQSVPVKVAPKDLWAPEQAKDRGMPGANLRVSTNGVKVWENVSGRLVPFSAAEV